MKYTYVYDTHNYDIKYNIEIFISWQSIEI